MSVITLVTQFKIPPPLRQVALPQKGHLPQKGEGCLKSHSTLI
jgi:hypothetical protein